MAATIKLNSGYEMLLEGLVVWRMEGESIRDHILSAIEVGYRRFDCAADYQNEAEVGEALEEAIKSGSVKREDLFITTKACKDSLKKLRLDYLDLYLVHFPIATRHTGVGTTSIAIGDDGVLDIDATISLETTWHAMEDLVSMGLVRSIGISNYDIFLTRDCLAYSKIKPSVNQIETHPHFQQDLLLRFCQKHDVCVMAHTPLGGSTGNPEWFGSVSWLDDPTLKEKQKASAKEGLHKYTKDVLLELCDLINVFTSKIMNKKDDLIERLLDNIAEPHASTGASLSDRETPTKSNKRKRTSRGSSSKEDLNFTPSKKSRNKQSSNSKRKGGMDTESGEEKEEDTDEHIAVKKQPKKRYKEAEKEIEGEEEYNEEDDDNEYRSGKKRESGSGKKKDAVTKNVQTPPAKAKANTQLSSLKNLASCAKDKNEEGRGKAGGTATVFSCKRKCLETTASKGSKSLGKKAALSGKGKAKAAAEEEAEQSSGPSKEELRATISDILKKVDFNVATFSDIVKKLGVHYKMDMSAKKVVIKMLIQEELTKLAEEAEENEDEEEYDEPVKKASAAKGRKASLSGKGKAKAASEDAQAEQSSGPNKEELRATISDILKKVDFNVATFSDLVKKLGVHYHMDMSAKKVIIKMLIQEELAKLSGG